MPGRRGYGGPTMMGLTIAMGLNSPASAIAHIEDFTPAGRDTSESEKAANTAFPVDL
ncbi:hypothetical protein P6U16_27470 (plasmid) [Rhizobium sp. 32-5/1]|uniref:hypothetical protein n=1 Tax=Rhizobium sp. 32-5/1 TaxID=3019602 RepID=UPI00240E55B5|nr:hypothetical protein [Rhizobium sp. 32-5/1]WEZ86290.1 hypothetical protein P6U16_27470 [Rhizobium sp. 32-5/1]